MIKKSNKQTVRFYFMLIFLLALSGCEFLEDIQKTAVPQLFPNPGTRFSPNGTPPHKPTLMPTALTPTLKLSPPEPLPAATEIESALSTSPFLRGMNIGNALEAPEPGLWGVTIQEAHFKSIAVAGFNVVRIPVRFSAHTSPSPNFTIDPNFLEVVDLAVNWGLDNGLFVILDFHGFVEIMDAPLQYEEQFLVIWDQLAEHYQSYPETLWFDLLNEPSNNLDPKTWNDLVASSVQIIRRTNPTRKILIGGINYSKFDTLHLLDLPSDPNLIGAFHFYTPFEFTHQGAGWVVGSEDWSGTTWEGSDSQKDTIRSALDRAMVWSHQTQTPILMAEFGAIKKADADSRRRWISFVAREAEERNISWLYWGFCSDLGVYNCEENAWDQSLLDALIQP